MTKGQFETVKGNDVALGDKLLFHRLKTVVYIREETSPFNAADVTRYATLKTDWLLDAQEIRLDPKQSYKRLKNV